MNNLSLECIWILTNIHEQRSYLVTDKTLVGEKEFCEIKLWRANITENDIRFKIYGDAFIEMLIYRTDIKHINIKINNSVIPRGTTSIEINNDSYILIESFLFKLTKVIIDRNAPKDIFLRSLFKRIVCEFKQSSMYVTEKFTAKIQPNSPSLTGRYINGEMI